ncbi:hypothetical protein B5F75_04775 [Candidatus Avelusimicrobium gallicola]|uniref:Uncharacterized protein n=2 Tax=Candidatus Avelusimicrobium gallicola TaxID=2562704 RepID=A0A1Y4DMQ5_9BACT|nr:hypothetical protein B5F75_04775 [Elusimicrobium sp. An273]
MRRGAKPPGQPVACRRAVRTKRARRDVSIRFGKQGNYLMKKIAVLLTALVVIYLAADYHVQRMHQLGAKLVQDAYRGDLLAVKEDLEQGAPPEYELYLQDLSRGYGGVQFTVLQAAASSGNEDLINFLLNEGFYIDYPTPQGWTPLFIAVRDGQAEAAKLLIYRNAELNAQTDRGATALMMALTQKFPSEKAREDLLLYLLKRGANPNLQDTSGHTALYYAAVLQNEKAAALLYEYGAAPDEEEKAQIRKLLSGKKDAAAKKILRLLKRHPQPVSAKKE